MDEVRGTIIGGDNHYWTLMYDGRRQASGHEDHRDSARLAAQTKCDELIATYSGYPCYLYPDHDLWAIFVEQAS
jgi:hypothetical protein